MKLSTFSATAYRLADEWVKKSTEPGMGWYLWYTPIPDARLEISSAMPTSPQDWQLATGDILGINRDDVIAQIWEETKGLPIFDTQNMDDYKVCPHCGDQMVLSRGLWLCRNIAQCAYTEPANLQHAANPEYLRTARIRQRMRMKAFRAYQRQEY